MPRGPQRTPHETLVFRLALLAGVPALIAVLIVLAVGGYPPKAYGTVLVLVIPGWLGFAWAARAAVVNSLYSLANVLSGIREGDFSIRARGRARDDALSEVTKEVNTLSSSLRNRRLGELEAAALLTTVMSEIDVAIFAFDDHKRLRLANHAGQSLLGQSAMAVLGRTAEEIGMKPCLEATAPSTLQLRFPGGEGRWGLRRSRFREGGKPHTLVVLTDLSSTLREEELVAWQRLVRVLGHELNNSLAPIKSLSGSLVKILGQAKRDAEWEQDLRSGLEIIESRADSLGRFLEAYSRLARLPKPVRAPFDLRALVLRLVGMESRIRISVTEESPTVTIRADAAQIEQALINLFKNAVEAALEDGTRRPEVTVSWAVYEDTISVFVDDNGFGLTNSGNLFVPFFTTKAEGSGIGLVLVRQIAENHEGTVSLENRRHARGCRATLSLPF